MLKILILPNTFIDHLLTLWELLKNFDSFLYLCNIKSPCRSLARGFGWRNIFLQAFICADFLTIWNSRKITCQSQGLSNGRCPWLCKHLIWISLWIPYRFLHTHAWASAWLLSDFDKAMREASNGRTATGSDSRAFPYNLTVLIRESWGRTVTDMLIILSLVIFFADVFSLLAKIVFWWRIN